MCQSRYLLFRVLGIYNFACMVEVLSFSAKAGNFAGSRKAERAHIGAAATAAIAVRGSKEPIPSSIRELLRESQS